MAAVKLAISMNDELLERLNEFCRVRGVTRSSVIAMSVNDYLDSYSVFPASVEKSERGKRTCPKRK